jgi:prepilin-type N-terminal cleavage/methylation domain-containing protein
MARLKRSDKGFTLIELVIAIALSAVVLLSASNLLINFGKFSANVVKNEASLMGTALGAFEEIVGKITAANEVTIPATAVAAPSIEIRVDTPNTASNFADDTVYKYWKSGTQLFKSVGSAAGSAIANDINSLSFVRDTAGPYKNHINVILEAQVAGGTGTKEHLETTVIMRSRSANLS